MCVQFNQQSQSKLLGHLLVFLVCKIWWVNCDKQHNLGEQGDGPEVKKKKKTALSGSVPTIFVWDCSYHYYTLQYYVKLQNS